MSMLMIEKSFICGHLRPLSGCKITFVLLFLEKGFFYTVEYSKKNGSTISGKVTVVVV